MGSLKPGSRANRSDQTILAAESDVKRVASAILPLMVIDRNSTAPLYKQIYDGYRSAIVRRMLRPGQRVPSTRALAKELHVSRIPVLNAYAQLLAEGYFQSRVGAGTVVSRSLPDESPIGSTRTPRPAKATSRRRTHACTGTHSRVFRREILGEFPRDAVAKTMLAWLVAEHRPDYSEMSHFRGIGSSQGSVGELPPNP